MKKKSAHIDPYVLQHILAKRSRPTADTSTRAMSRTRFAASAVYTVCVVAGRIALKSIISRITIDKTQIIIITW